MSKKPQPSVHDKALDLLARRRLSRGELRWKLLVRKYEEAEVENTLDRLQELGLLDDKALAEDYAENRVSAKPMGKRLLLQELQKRLVETELAESAAEKALEGLSEEDLAEQALQREMRLTKDVKKLYSRMLRLGFGYEVVEEALRKSVIHRDEEDKSG